MSFGPTVLIYILVGLGVATAVSLRSESWCSAELWFTVGVAIPFWPFFVPVLLAKKPVNAAPTSEPAAKDGMSLAIAEVDRELEAALASLVGWADDVLTGERDRIHELRTAWNNQAEKIREMDRLLALPEQATQPPESAAQPDVLSSAARDRLRRSQELRRQNVDRLGEVRQRAFENLMASLAWVRELVSMIHLARFTGAPAVRAGELVTQIAGAVEGLADFTDQDETPARGS